MRLLIITQAVDEKDPSLSFFVRWLREFSEHFTHIHVVCLKEGEHALPENVSVHSLGKEQRALRARYVFRLFRFAWHLRGEYDAVFIHMNQEYVLLAGWLWKLLGKPVYLWRNHYAGNMWTDIAASFSHKVFCTSKFSYTAKYKKTVLMPVGIDTVSFAPIRRLTRKEGSILYFGRFAPSKKPHVLIEALKKIHAPFNVSFYGSPLPEHSSYRDSVIKSAHGLPVRFFAGVPNSEAPRIFNEHDIYVNLGGTGMYDKTIFEAASSGCLVLASSSDFRELAGARFSLKEDGSDLSDKLERLLALSEGEKRGERDAMRALAAKESLKILAKRLKQELTI